MLVKNLLPFATRTVLIYTLGKTYLGLNGLFSSLLQMLSLAELGFGSAVVFSMYKPLAEGDSAAVSALLRLYRRVYRWIGLGILAAGLLLMPMLPWLIHDGVPPGINLYLLYSIHLVNTAISYLLFAYKKSLLAANQRSDIISKLHMVLSLVSGLAQIAALLLFHSFYLYSLVLPCITLLENIGSELAARRLFPQYVCRGEVPAEEVQRIKKNVIGLFAYKVSQVFRNSFDSIVLSAFLGLEAVAKHNNYLYILNTLIVFLQTVTNSSIAGIGNKLVLCSRRENHADMNRFQLLFMWAAAWCTVCLYCLYQPFIELWVGAELLFDDAVMTVFCVYFFTRAMNLVCYAYRQAAGLWWEDRFRPVVEALSNLTLNILLVRRIGVLGVLLSTVLTMIPFNTIWGSYILYSRFFKEENYAGYLARLVYYAAMTFAGCLLTARMCTLLPVMDLWQTLICRAVLCMVVPNLLFLLLLRVLPEFRPAMALLRKLVHKKKRSSTVS